MSTGPWTRPDLPNFDPPDQLTMSPEVKLSQYTINNPCCQIYIQKCRVRKHDTHESVHSEKQKTYFIYKHKQTNNKFLEFSTWPDPRVHSTRPVDIYVQRYYFHRHCWGESPISAHLCCVGSCCPMCVSVCVFFLMNIHFLKHKVYFTMTIIIKLNDDIN